ncbi:hypothetical protein U1Q18_042843 [Sarracenia purpurea var. burkii]
MQIKLNVNGLLVLRRLFRDGQGGSVLGYIGKMVTAASMEAEFWGILGGLVIVKERGGFDPCHMDSNTGIRCHKCLI